MYFALNLTIRDRIEGQWVHIMDSTAGTLMYAEGIPNKLKPVWMHLIVEGHAHIVQHMSWPQPLDLHHSLSQRTQCHRDGSHLSLA